MGETLRAVECNCGSLPISVFKDVCPTPTAPWDGWEGRKALTLYQYWGTHRIFYLYCRRCNLTGPKGFSRLKGIEWWNHAVDVDRTEMIRWWTWRRRVWFLLRTRLRRIKLKLKRKGR